MSHRPKPPAMARCESDPIAVPAHPAARTFRSAVEGLRISAAAKRELLDLHDREVAAERDAAEARCLDPRLGDRVREVVRHAVAITRAETLSEVAEELGRFADATETAAKQAAHEARVELALLSSRRVDAAPLALVVAGTDAMFDALDAARDASTLAPDDPDRPHSVRLGYSSPTPLAALAKRARESGVAVTRDADKEPA